MSHLPNVNVLVLPGEIVLRCEEEHAVALLPLAHGNAGAVPVAVVRLRLLVVVVAARAQGRA